MTMHFVLYVLYQRYSAILPGLNRIANLFHTSSGEDIMINILCQSSIFPYIFAKLVAIEIYILIYFSMQGCILCMDCDLWFVRVCGYAGWCGGVGVGDKVSCWHQATPGKLMGQPRLEGERRSPGGSSWGRRGLSCEALSRSLQAVLVLLCGSQVFSVRCERLTRKSAAQEERATF